jgi:transcription elongation factor Elf1
MTKSLFLLVSHKFSNENMEATLVCPKCDQVFKKEFPIDLEGQIIEFKCSACNSSGEADLPYKKTEDGEEPELDLADFEQEK